MDDVPFRDRWKRGPRLRSTHPPLKLMNLVIRRLWKDHIKFRVAFRGCKQSNPAANLLCGRFGDVKADTARFGSLRGSRKHLE